MPSMPVLLILGFYILVWWSHQVSFPVYSIDLDSKNYQIIYYHNNNQEIPKNGEKGYKYCYSLEVIIDKAKLQNDYLKEWNL